jgi:hypothetical protein
LWPSYVAAKRDLAAAQIAQRAGYSITMLLVVSRRGENHY